MFPLPLPWESVFLSSRLPFLVCVLLTPLIPGGLPAQDLIISEFLASNETGHEDEDGDREDWLEIHNGGAVAVNLEGWFLTDDAGELNKWSFPSVEIAAGGQLLVFASGKDRRDPEGELHTNFKLSSGGEYLALAQPNASTIEHEFSPAFPVQVTDVSYGIQQTTSETVLVTPGIAAKYRVPTSGTDDVLEGTNPNPWIGTNFPDSAWMSGLNGIGYATATPDAYDAHIHTDVQGLMFDGGTSIYIRIPFQVSDPSGLSAMTLKMQFDDGFVCYLNGNPLSVAEENAETPDELDYQSKAIANHDDSEAINPKLYPISPSLLNAGDNVLCIHGLNRSPSSSDALFVAELVGTAVTGTGSTAYFTTPTPGDPNVGGANTPGPLIRSVTNDLPPLELQGGGLTVVADSVAEFSGNQGENGWFYGYQEGGGIYDPGTDFVAFTGGAGQGTWNGSTQQWTGTLWDLNIASSAPWTSLGASGVHPNDSNPGPEHYTIRRWVSDRSGMHTITGQFYNTNAGGDGTTGRVFHEGVEIFAEVSDGGPKAFSIERTLGVGDRIDFMVDNGPFDADGADGTQQTAVIYQGSPSPNTVVIEAEVLPTENPVTAVTLTWRVMYEADVSVPMVDDGTGDDQVAGDGTYTATIVTSTLSAGEMLRWKVSATDSGGGTATQPPFGDPLDSPEYFGTIAEDPSVLSSSLPIFHWFTSNPGGANTTSGARGAVYFLGQFYDNVHADRHGQSTGGFPKKSYNFDFNRGDRFRYREGERRVKDVDLLTNWADKSKTRNTLGYEIVNRSGHPGHFAFPVRIQQNATFFSTADMVEDGDDRYLDRVGLDGEGALYKMYNRLDSSTSGVNKKTRKEENNSDLQALITGLGQSGDAKLRYGYDHINLPGTLNYLAVLDLTNNRDHGHKNYYLYRDTNGTREWRPLVWDIDLCLGRNWISGPAYFDDTFTNNNLRSGANNRLKSLIFDDVTLNQMYLRRMRTLIDEQLGTSANPVTWLETRVDELVSLIDSTNDSPSIGDDDADLDYRKWGSWGNQNAMRPAADRIKFEHLPSRRAQLAGIGELPPSQPIAPTIAIGTVDYNPVPSGASSDQGGEYFQMNNPNGYAVDLSHWKISGGVSMTLPAGAVIPAGGSLYVAREAVGFRARSVSPKADEKRYVVSGYAGQLSARGETLTLADQMDNEIASLTYPGNATATQNQLRVTEILYAPLPPTAQELALMPTVSASSFEFVELQNIGASPLALGGVRFVTGVTFTFSAMTLNPGEHVLVVADQAAFQLRYGNGFNIAGEYEGRLSNDGEEIQILDSSGENVLEFDFNDVWYDPTDDDGYSLVVLDPEGTPFTEFDEPSRWGVSLQVGGNPGQATGGVSMTFAFWKQQNLTPQELLDPEASGDDADSDRDGLGLMLEYGMGLDPRSRDGSAGYQAALIEVGGTEYYAFTFRRQKNVLHTSYQVEMSDDLVSWEEATVQVGVVVDNGDGTETVTIRDTHAATGGRRFVRLGVMVD